SPEHPDGNPAFGFASPSIHFRHRGRANVLWADGHITSERWEWAPDRNVYGTLNRGWSVGWFGPRNNYYFTVNDKSNLPQSSARKTTESGAPASDAPEVFSVSGLFRD